MKLSGLTTMLSDPKPTERDILEVDLSETDISTTSQHSFLNSLTADLEARVIQVDKNTNQKIIIVTQDKALLCLKRNIAKLGKREWIAPLSTVTTILISLITSNFKTALGLGPAEWRAIFIVAAFLSTGWLCYSVNKAMKARTFHEVIHDIIYGLAAKKRYI